MVADLPQCPAPRHPPPGPLCKGDWLIGTACGRCDRCLRSAPQVIKQLRKENQELSAKNAEYYYNQLRQDKVLGKSEAVLFLLRQFGWSVAVHNDYRQDGQKRTFWLMVKNERALKGEGATDEESLQQILDKVFDGNSYRALSELCRVLDEVRKIKP